MKTVGIIAEYNPFHTGHEYHIKKSKELSGADYAVVVMSPDFVQRGDPAFADKYTRTQMALLSGADLVIELPVCYATGSAEYFAEGGVTLLSQLGVINTLCFGAETDNIRMFHLAARILTQEPEEFRAKLQTLLKQGFTFPQARSAALASFLSDSSEDFQHFLETPNNILGVEYCKALQKSFSQILPIPVKRTGSAFGSRSLDGRFCSATALREGVSGSSVIQYRTTERFGHGAVRREYVLNENSSRRLFSYIPNACQKLFEQAARTPITSEDLLPYLMLRLMDSSAEELTGYLDISPDLADRIMKLRFSLVDKTYEEIVALLKTRQMTETRIRRALLHLILGILARDVETYRENGTAFYAHILGFRKDASSLLHAIKEESEIPLITKTASAAKQLSEAGLAMWEKDIYASHLYRTIQNNQYGIPFRTEYEISPVII